MKNKFSIVFMGTPEFASTILKSIVENDIEVKAVITVPDKPSGRGQKINQSDVKKYAVEQNLTILQPSNLKDPIFQEELKALEADLFVVVAFRMLPESVWSMPSKGTINLHASLLPDYRGAAPINWAIINGDKETGVTTFFIEKEIDTGKIIQQESTPIGENENIGELYNRLMTIGSRLMLKTIHAIAENSIQPINQNELIKSELRSAPKIFKDDCQIDFNKSAQDVHNFIRGLSPYPAAWCTLHDESKGESKTYKFFESCLPLEQRAINKVEKSKDGILIPCADGHIIIKEIQVQGKRRMNYKDFLAGNSLENLKQVL